MHSQNLNGILADEMVRIVTYADVPTIFGELFQWRWSCGVSNASYVALWSGWVHGVG